MVGRIFENKESAWEKFCLLFFNTYTIEMFFLYQDDYFFVQKDYIPKPYGFSLQQLENRWWSNEYLKMLEKCAWESNKKIRSATRTARNDCIF